jgi:hypothetical protein
MIVQRKADGRHCFVPIRGIDAIEGDNVSPKSVRRCAGKTGSISISYINQIDEAMLEESDLVSE